MKKLFLEKRKHYICITCFVVSVFIMLSFCSCGKAQEFPEKQSDVTSDFALKIVAVNFPCYDFARAVTGGKAEIVMLIPPGNEVHSYEPTPQDMITIGTCDLFLYTGGESDIYIEEILESFPKKSFEILKIMDLVQLYEEEIVEGMQVRSSSHDHSSNEPAYSDEAEYDEHVWTSPKNALLIVSGIEEAIAELDPDNEKFYEENANDYINQIKRLDRQFEELFAKQKEEAIFVGDRFPFLYFAKDYGIDYYAVFPSCNGESEPSARTMAFFIEKAKEYQSNTIFHLELSNKGIAQAAAEAAGADIKELHSCHNVTKEDFQKGVTYVELMERNYHGLREAFSWRY